MARLDVDSIALPPSPAGEQMALIALRGTPAWPEAKGRLVREYAVVAAKAAIYRSRLAKLPEKEAYFSAALEGICVALDRYDPSRGVKLITFLTHYAVGYVRMHARVARRRRPEVSIADLSSDEDRDLIAEFARPEPDERPVDAERVNRVIDAALPARHAEIIRMRFGIGRPSGMTLCEVGEVYRISKERVRQIEAHAIAKLRPLLADIA